MNKYQFNITGTIRMEEYDVCIAEKRRHDLAEASEPSAGCMMKYKDLFNQLDTCYKSYKDGFDPGTWHDCEKMVRKNYIKTKVENYLFDKK